ncbi:hypothetical protein BH23ACT10_BH23ACT10_17810 [soil metagenome]
MRTDLARHAKTVAALATVLLFSTGCIDPTLDLNGPAAAPVEPTREASAAQGNAAADARPPAKQQDASTIHEGVDGDATTETDPEMEPAPQPTELEPTARESEDPTADDPASSTAAACDTTGGVVIPVDANAANVMRGRPAGTTYVVAAGVHRGNFSVQPRSGDTFCGEPGAVLDGGGRLRTAFSGFAANVTLDSLTARAYDDGRQGGAISPNPRAPGWVVRNVSAVENHWAGLLAADGMKVLGGEYNDNGQLGIGGNGATGILLDGLDGDRSTIDGPEIARNKTLRESCSWEGGGFKWSEGTVIVRNAHVHHNACKGLWADINARKAVIEYNLVEDNKAEGIFYEISQDAVIRNNQVYRNGLGMGSWYWGGGITAASSFNVEVYGNRLSGNYNGVTGTQQNRTEFSPPAHLLDGFSVHDNTICATAGKYPTGVGADNGVNLAARTIAFNSNTVQDTPCD